MGAGRGMRRGEPTARSTPFEQMAAILCCLSDAVLVVDGNGSMVLTNSAFDRLFGPRAERFSPLDGVDPRALAAEGVAHVGEMTAVDSSGMQRWFEFRTSPVGSDGGVVVLIDRGERRQLRLDQEFMALASHELRSPLTALGGFISMLERQVGAELDGPGQRHLERAHTQVQRLTNLVEELSDLARLQSGTLSLNVEELSLAGLVGEVVEVARVLSTRHELRLLVDTDAEHAIVRADPHRLEQVLLNLVSNAVKYAPDCERIDVRLAADGERLCVAVQDYGDGIDDEDPPRVFQRYYRAHRTSRPPAPGLGLGLHISREIMRAHGGDLELSATSGDGTVFTLWLPRS